MITLLFLAACGPKNTAPEAPLVGWHQEEGWAHSCYFPPDFGSLQELQKREAREKSMDQMILQWRGSRSDGISFDADRVEEVETALLGRPEKIDNTSRENLTHCKSVATGVAARESWGDWVKTLPGILTAGECQSSILGNDIFDYLEIEGSWDREFTVCMGDRIRLRASSGDRYKIEENGPWINVDGDPDRPGAGTDLPCNRDGCFAGQLLMKFTSEDDYEEIMPVGTELIYTAPSKGTISYAINDNTFYDNSWYKSGGVVEHTEISLSASK
jgi:hypothetical protein